MRFSFRVDGIPVGYKRSTAKHGFLPARVAAWRRDIQIAYRASGGPDMAEYRGPVALFVEFIGTPADCSNLAKEVEDALNGLAWGDDRQIVELRVDLPNRRLSPVGVVLKDKGEPGMAVTIHFLDGNETQQGAP